jgi:Fis family transcriptional regulator, factor for inversion stimulation protein
MSKEQIEACVQSSLDAYFKDLGGEAPHELHAMMMACMERPLLVFVLDKAGGNQSKAAQWLGLNRNTLRKKLTDLGLSCELNNS